MIRKIEENDLEVVFRIEKELFLEDAWNKNMFLDEMNQNPFSNIYIYETNGEIVGYFDLLISYENAEIANIGVSTKYQNRGIACEMMEFILQLVQLNNCENFTLEVRKSNESAIHVYEKYGFKKVSTRKNYYADGEDAYLMYQS